MVQNLLVFFVNIIDCVVQVEARKRTGGGRLGNKEREEKKEKKEKKDDEGDDEIDCKTFFVNYFYLKSLLSKCLPEQIFEGLE